VNLIFICQKNNRLYFERIVLTIGVARGIQGAMSPNVLAYLAILCFEKRCPRQNTVARLKADILAPTFFWYPKKFWAGYTTGFNIVGIPVQLMLEKVLLSRLMSLNGQGFHYSTK